MYWGVILAVRVLQDVPQHPAIVTVCALEMVTTGMSQISAINREVFVASVILFVDINIRYFPTESSAAMLNLAESKNLTAVAGQFSVLR
jgi:hypothetical protein